MKNYNWLLLSMAVVSVINGLLYPVMALYVYSISQDYLLVGLIMALPFIAAVPMSFLWGMASDRIGSRRTVMVGAGSVGGALFFAMPFAGATGLIALRFAQVAFTTSFVLQNAVATECFPDRKGRSVGDLNLVGGIGSAMGALAVGFLLPSGQMAVGSGAVQLVFYLAGALTIAASLSMLPIREHRIEIKQTRIGKMLSFGERRGVAIVSLVAFVLPLSGYMVFSTFPIYLSGLDLGWDATLVVGVFTALSAITGIFASGLAGRACDRFGRRWVLVGAGAAYALVWLGMALTRDPLLVAALWAVPVWSFFYIGATAMVSDLTRDDERGRGIGLVNSALYAGGATGSIIAGYMLSRGFADNAFLMAAAVAVVGTFVALAARETLKRAAPTS